jgi:hypothetical protein
MAAMGALVGLALGGVPAMAQQISDGMAAAEGFPLSPNPAPPADTGKPLFFAPPAMRLPPAANCDAALDCRLRAIGTVQHNGAVELEATILKW